MKRFSLFTIFVLFAVLCFGQNKQQETTYRRSSLYALMFPDKSIDSLQNDAIEKAFIEKAFPDKYNNHNLTERVLNADSLINIQVSEEEVNGAVIEGAKERKSWLNRQLDKLGIILTDDYNSSLSDAEYAAKLEKYFDENYVAGKLVAKWFGGPDSIPDSAMQINTKLIEERGINTLGTDELNRAKALVGGKEKLVAGAEYDLLGRTFVTVSRYTFLSAEIMRKRLEQGAAKIDSMLGSLNPLKKISAMAVRAAILSRMAGLNGFRMAANTYLFHLNLDKDKINELITKYSNDIRGLYTDNTIKLKYVGKATYRDPLLDIKGEWVKFGRFDAKSEDMVEDAVIRATDGTIAELQEDYAPFKTKATLHQSGKKLYAYIGSKEGCEEGDEFDVLQKTIDDYGREVFKSIKTIEIKKGELWDNRVGASKATYTGKSKKDKGTGNPNLKYSGFGSSNKLLEGSLIVFKKH